MRCLTFLWLCALQAVYGADKSITLDMHQEAAASKTGDLTNSRFPSLYWYTNVSVGDGGPYKLSIDTGSTDCLINPGLYKPSKYRQPYPGTTKFAASFEEDVVSAAGFSFKAQPLGDVTSYNLSDTHHLPAPLPGQGILAFSGLNESQFTPKAPAWWHNLYTSGQISNPRFGLAFGTSGKGQIVLGTYNQSLANGPLFSTEQLYPNGPYFINGDVYVNGEKIVEDQYLPMDVGTTNIQATLDAGRAIFRKLNWHNTVTQRDRADVFGKEREVLIESAFFPCNKPSVLGFGFKDAAGSTKIFNVSTASWGLYNHGNNNCTSVLGATNGHSRDARKTWLVGHAFFVGHYVDFNNAAGNSTIGFANLKDPAM